MTGKRYPSNEELTFLTLSYDRFLNLFDEIMKDDFWNREASYRLMKSKDIFSVYSEILKYPPIKWVIENNNRPNFSDMGIKLFKFLRNVLLHFPYFNEWDEVWINSSLVNLYTTKPQFIDRYLRENEGKEEMKYRFWEEAYKRMTYITIKYPKDYSQNNKVFIKDMLEEKAGIKFSAIFMKSILLTQVEQIKNT